tara:strand:- start:5691 stop:6488 length:798 start_codon:yes stop_codon:yes gene_type:complete
MNKTIKESNMTQNEILKLKDKMQKLLNHATSAEEIGNQAEAEAFMKKLNKLCMQHKVAMAEVQAFDPSNSDESITDEMVDLYEEGLPIIKRRQQIVENLARAIAKANNCTFLVQTRSNNIYFVGREQDRRFAIQMFSYAWKTMLADCHKEQTKTYYHFKKLGMLEQAKGFRASFKRGFVSAITQRLNEAKEEVRKSTSEETFALITVQAMVAVENYVDSKYGRKANSIGGQSGHNGHGYAAGQKSGRSVGLHVGNVGSGSTKLLN